MSGLPLRVLVLEDEPADAELELAALAEGGFDCAATLADGRAAFEAAFAPGRFDLVLADYRLPDYTGLEALEESRVRGKERAREFNALEPRDVENRTRVLRETFGTMGEHVWVEPPLSVAVRL